MKLLLVFVGLFVATVYGTIITAPVAYTGYGGLSNVGYGGLSNVGYGGLNNVGYGLSRSVLTVPSYNSYLSYNNLGYRNLGSNLGYGLNGYSSLGLLGLGLNNGLVLNRGLYI